MSDRWHPLWDIANTPDGPATIEIDPGDAGLVYLVFPDGSDVTLHWDNGQWNFPEDNWLYISQTAGP